MKSIVKRLDGRQGAALARAKRKINQSLSAQQKARLLAILDLSGSMTIRDAGEHGQQARVDVLETALRQIMADYPDQVAVVGFACTTFAIKRLPLPCPGGSTSLTKALRATTASAVGIGKVVLVSDGEPTDDQQAEALAIVAGWARAGVTFSVIYCGPEGGVGQGFLNQLAHAGQGTYTVRRTVAELTDGITKAMEETQK